MKNAIDLLLILSLFISALLSFEAAFWRPGLIEKIKRSNIPIVRNYSQWVFTALAITLTFMGVWQFVNLRTLSNF